MGSTSPDLRERLQAVFRHELAHRRVAIDERLIVLRASAATEADRQAAARDILRAAHSLKAAARLVDDWVTVCACHQLEERLAPARFGVAMVGEVVIAAVVAFQDALDPGYGGPPSGDTPLDAFLEVACLSHARATGKTVVFDTHGLASMSTSAEGLREMLLHLVTNAIDHGIELPKVRSKLGKPRQGRVSVEYDVVGDQQIYAVHDDGRGFDLELLRRAARRVRCDAAEGIEVAWLSGVTTCAAVTAFSGRGLGLDIVRQRACELGGVVELSSAVNRGSRVVIRVPDRAGRTTIGERSDSPT